MKVCLCLSTFKRILAAARRGGFKGIVTKTISKDTFTRTKKITVKRKTKSKGKGKKKQSAKQKAAIAKFTRAAKKCKGKGKGFKPCMKRELKKRK